MKNNKNFSQWLSLFLLGFCLIIVYKLFDNLGTIGSLVGRLLSILTPFVIGFFIAFILYAPVRKIDTFIRKCKWKVVKRSARPLAVLIVYLLALGLLALIFYAVLPALITALVDFINDVPTYYNNVMAFLKEYTQPGGFLENFDIENKVREIYAAVMEQLTVERILSYMRSVVNFTSSLVDVVMALIVSVYMLLGRESLLHAVKQVCGLMLKPKQMNFCSLYCHKTARIFYNYFYSQVLDALVVGVLATIGLLLARMPNAPVLGMLLGIMNMIPYFGALIGGVLCVLFALLNGNFYGAVFVAIYILVMQQIDSNLIQPRIVGQTVGIRPIYVLLGITLGGGLIGFWGIIIGPPILAVVQMMITDYIQARNVRKPKKITTTVAETTDKSNTTSRSDSGWKKNP